MLLGRDSTLLCLKQERKYDKLREMNGGNLEAAIDSASEVVGFLPCHYLPLLTAHQSQFTMIDVAN